MGPPDSWPFIARAAGAVGSWDFSMEIPAIEIEHVHGQGLAEVNSRGVGEGGTIAAPPAIANAVADALGGVRVNTLPLTPERVLDLLDAAAAAQ